VKSGALGPESIVVTGVGMVSALGQGAALSCAAARAGASRARSLDEWAESKGLPLGLRGHAVSFLEGSASGLERLVRLGALAVSDLVASASVPNDGRTGLIVNTSSGYHLAALGQPGRPAESRRAEYEKHLAAAIATSSGLFVDPRATGVLFQDQTPMTEAFQFATAWLRQRVVDRVVVGGADSALEPSDLSAFDHFGLLKTKDRPTGFLPGEAAAFLLLERADAARRRGGPVEAVLHPPRYEQADGGRLAGAPATGILLGRVVEQTLTALQEGGGRVGLTVAGLNGDEVRSSEWGGALARLGRSFPDVGRTTWYPAESFGETIGAAAPVAACVALRAMARGYAHTDDVLLWQLSDAGAREAFCVSRVEA
jgi:3-oxoacyl-(acyl-carrier-protein) synthase